MGYDDVITHDRLRVRDNVMAPNDVIGLGEVISVYH
jgi:hypothetical protein